MSSLSGIKAAPLIALLLGCLALALAGCSDIYTDRRETIALHAGDAMAANRVTHMIDPWPAHSANRNIAFNGEKMQTAHERYRTGRIIPPVNATTSSIAYSQAQQAAQSTSNSQAASAPNGSKP
jgi:cytochrome c oxidase assembly factor CtaG